MSGGDPEPSRVEERLRALDWLGSRVVGHEGSEFVALEPPPRARGEHRCACGHRTPLGTEREAVRFFNHHLRQEVLAGAVVIAGDGRAV